MFEPLTMESFAERTGIGRTDLLRDWKNVCAVVSLRQVANIESIQAMPMEYLTQLLHSVCLLGSERYVYKGCAFAVANVDPNTVRIGQTFVERIKYQGILEGFRGVFKKFCIAEGVSRMSPMCILGVDACGRSVLAHYLPPIVEMNGGAKGALLDGVHRCFLGRAIGSTLQSIIVEHPKVPFPCSLHAWDAVSVVSAKPPAQERFFDLRQEFFRDVKRVGIDG